MRSSPESGPLLGFASSQSVFVDAALEPSEQTPNPRCPGQENKILQLAGR